LNSITKKLEAPWQLKVKKVDIQKLSEAAHCNNDFLAEMINQGVLNAKETVSKEVSI